jgi:exopolysaccharide biosynthesis WecB/TagA/CpsF family protein
MSISLDIDDFDLDGFSAVARDFGQTRYGYVVTANTDQLIRYYDDPNFRKLYAAAAYVVLDSRFLANWLALTRNLRLKVCPGSDLTARVLERTVQPRDRIVVIGGTVAQADLLRARFSLECLHHHNPPMGFVHDPAALEQCLLGIEAASPFRFCFLGVGSPQQEVVAQRLLERGAARGLALCVGGSVNYLTGGERRAPEWLQRIGFEWLYRLIQDPGRMAKRYLKRGPRIFRLLAFFEFRLRRPLPGAGGS